MNKNGIVRMMLAGVALFSLLTLLAACGGGGDSGAAPGVSGTITLAASATTMPADGSSSVVITATVKDGAGNPVRHYTDVNFSTTLGYFRNGGTSYTVQTLPPLVNGKPDIKADPTGIAEVSLQAGTTPGAAKVTVASNGVTQSVYITLTGGSAGITLTADPASIPADGKSSTTITATLTDASGNPVKPGTYVTFTTGLGHFLSGLKSYTVSTPDTTGIVKVALHSGVVPGTTYVVATSNEISQALQLVFTDTAASVLSISANPLVIPADGVSTSLVTATVKDASGKGIADVPITFYDANVPTQPSPLPDDNIWKGASSNSHVTPDFYCYSGNITFTLTYTGSLTSNFAVRLWNRDTLKVASLLINTTGPVTEEKVSRTLGAGNYYFQVDADGGWEIKVDGSIGPAQVDDKPKVLAVTQTNSSGNAQYVYTSTVTAGIMKIRAETGELNVNESEEALTATVEITQTGLAPAAISVGANPSQIYANGQETTTVQATVTDKNGNYAADGTLVSFSATLGTIESVAQTIDGIASATLTSIASSTTVASTVTAKVQLSALSDSIQVTFIGISLTDMKAEPATIFANGTDTSSISVRLRDAFGAAVEGETIAFIISSGSGTLNPSVAVTNSLGIATVEIIAPTTAGTALVTAGYGLISASTGVTFTAFPTVGSITLTADPTTIPNNGTSTSKITAEITDTASAPVPKGTSVTFTTTLGKFSNGLQTQTVITPDATGTVSVSLISATTSGSALVTATSSNVTQSVYVGFGGAAVKIVLTADPDQIWADGVSSSAIQARLTDAGGAPVTPGTLVAFTTTLGKFANGLQSYTVPTPDNTGIVTVSLIAGTTTGSATVSASASGVAQSVYVDIIQKGGNPFSMTLSANPTTLPADGTSSSIITATLKDSAGNPVKAGTSVTFSTTLGNFSNKSKVITVTTPDANGVVSVSLTSGTASGSAAVTATSDGVTQTVYVTFTGTVVASITLTATPDTLSADGVSNSIIRAEVRDAQGNPIADGEQIGFVVTSGTGTLSAASAMTVGGFATVTYTASTTVGFEVIQATAQNGVLDTVEIELTGPTVGSITVEANPTTILADGRSTSEVTALVKTVDNQVIKGVDVVFTTTRGAITSPHTTDVNGQAIATLTSERHNGAVTVTASCQDKTASTLVAFTGITLTLDADPESLQTGETAALTVTLLDAAGNPMPGVAVSIAVTEGSGTITPASPWVTDTAGKALGNFTLTGTQSAKLKAESRGATAEATINYVIYSFIMLEPNPTTIRVGGESSLITAELRESGVPKSGETVNFSSTIGTVAPLSQVTGVDGRASTYLTSGSQAGTATIGGVVTVSGNTLNASTQVVITGGTAMKIVLTASPSVIPTKIGTSTITANVYDVNDQPAAGQDIYFRINESPGGGEYLNVSVKTTDAYGVAKVQFYAGALASTLGGVVIEANTQPNLPPKTGIYGLATLTIAGPVANIGIGMNLETLEPDGGCLKIDICGVATDISGNPVADGTKINFSVEAIKFDEDRDNDFTIDCWDVNRNPLIPCPPSGTPGFGTTWFSDDVNQDGAMYNCDNIRCVHGPMCTTEDVNHNRILDPGEDKNDNGVIDPIQGCVIDSSVATVNGTATATLTYPMPQANNITVRITAESGGVSNFYETILLCTSQMVENGTCGIGY